MDGCTTDPPAGRASYKGPGDTMQRRRTNDDAPVQRGRTNDGYWRVVLAVVRTVVLLWMGGEG
jgi:hypothetical protein